MSSLKLNVEQKAIPVALRYPEHNVLSEKEMVHKIGALKALQIQLISSKVAEHIINNLGPKHKHRIASLIKQKTSQIEDLPPAMLFVREMEAKKAAQANKEVFSQENMTRFFSEALTVISAELTEGFSTAEAFLESGLMFEISEYAPSGILAKITKQMGVKLSSLDVPVKYRVFLKIEKTLSQEKKDLVFELTAKSDNIVVSQDTFTLAELEKVLYAFRFS